MTKRTGRHYWKLMVPSADKLPSSGIQRWDFRVWGATGGRDELWKNARNQLEHRCISTNKDLIYLSEVLYKQLSALIWMFDPHSNLCVILPQKGSWLILNNEAREPRAFSSAPSSSTASPRTLCITSGLSLSLCTQNSCMVWRSWLVTHDTKTAPYKYQEF